MRNTNTLLTFNSNKIENTTKEMSQFYEDVMKELRILHNNISEDMENFDCLISMFKCSDENYVKAVRSHLKQIKFSIHVNRKIAE